MTRVEKIIAYSSWYDGRQEISGNKGFKDKAFEKEMKSVGWYVGAPWCAFFTKLILKKAYADNKELQAVILKCCNGSAKQTADNLKASGVFEFGTEPKPGALVIWLNGKGPAGHAGLVKSVDTKNNTMYNVEGNTNNTGNRDGEVVNAHKPRTISRPFQANGLNIYLYIYAKE
ncbi:CHAP domain protein [compost metagenome]